MPVKAGPLGPLIDNTTVTLYGHFDLSLDGFNPSVFDQGTKARADGKAPVAEVGGAASL